MKFFLFNLICSFLFTSYYVSAKERFVCATWKEDQIYADQSNGGWVEKVEKDAHQVEIFDLNSKILREWFDEVLTTSKESRQVHCSKSIWDEKIKDAQINFEVACGIGKYKIKDEVRSERGKKTCDLNKFSLKNLKKNYYEFQQQAGTNERIKQRHNSASSQQGCTPMPPRCASASQKGMQLLQTLPQTTGISDTASMQFCSYLIGIEINSFCAQEFRNEGRARCADLSTKQAQAYKDALPQIQVVIDKVRESMLRDACSWENK